MSLMCSVYVPEGIVLAAESRMMANVVIQTPDGSKKQQGMINVSDNAQKVFLFSKVKVGVSTCGSAVLNGMLAAEYLRRFELEEVYEGDGVTDVAKKLQSYAFSSFPAVHFFVCGYEGEEPFVYDVSKELKRLNMNNGKIVYAASWNGEQTAVTRLLNTQPAAPVNHALMPLKDAVDFADFLIDTTIKLQRFTMLPKVCGGETDILVLTKDDAYWYRHKLIKPSKA